MSAWSAIRYGLRVAGTIALLGAPGCIGYCDCAEPEPAPAEVGPRAAAEGEPRVFLLRGLWDFFSIGLDDLAVELRGQGFDAEALSGPAWADLGARLEQEYAAGERRPIVLIGHSFGSDDAVRVARYLNQRGVPVELLALIDATNPDSIPPNVARCVHWYLTSWAGDAAPQTFAGNPVAAQTDNDRTEIVNLELTCDELGAEAFAVNHFTIEESDHVHRLVIAELRALGPDATAEPQPVAE